MRPRRTPTLRQISSRSSSVTPYPCFSYTIYRIKPSLLSTHRFLRSSRIVRLVYGGGHRPDHNPKETALGLKSPTSLVPLRWGDLRVSEQVLCTPTKAVRGLNVGGHQGIAGRRRRTA